jgi:PAP2 superfamily
VCVSSDVARGAWSWRGGLRALWSAGDELATKATAVYGMLAALLAAATSRWARKVAIWTAALLVAGLVGLTRLYLGAHWLTDVLGGFTLGGAWLFLVLAAARTVDGLRGGRQPDTRQLSGGRADREPVGAPVGRREPVRRDGRGPA